MTEFVPLLLAGYVVASFQVGITLRLTGKSLQIITI